jgi:hypothetical protein
VRNIALGISLGIILLASGLAARAQVATSPGFNAPIAEPTKSRVSICHGFGCKNVTEVELNASDRARLTSFMAAGAASPAAERHAVATAAAWFDKRIAPTTGTKNHQARAGIDFTFAKTDGQFDCVDSSRNTTTFLSLLAELKLLRHHTVGEPVARGFFIDGRLPHATAVLIEKKGGETWSVDSWVRAYGQQPEIMPLSRWQAGGA